MRMLGEMSSRWTLASLLAGIIVGVVVVFLQFVTQAPWEAILLATTITVGLAALSAGIDNLIIAAGQRGSLFEFQLLALVLLNLFFDAYLFDVEFGRIDNWFLPLFALFFIFCYAVTRNGLARKSPTVAVV